MIRYSIEPIQYEPGEISYGVSVENIFQVEVSAGPSYNEIKKLPNKVLLWCGTRSSNLLRHLHKGFLAAVCALPVSGYTGDCVFGCSCRSCILNQKCVVRMV
ncbi:hypothetical protein L1987_14136 [Smallanthus sonchifolius]|uniref:Uncharacterized protein n=1 Tax=Smallanthus sonchifolius TaxID=185202 RepID=A0ACB9J433_9ASTR|nr:hypothetical protein L1987_14136 [Smallanthus sonchifolius]